MNDIRIFGFADEADSNIDGQIAAMLRNGLDGLEIRGVDGTNISNITIEKAKEVKSKLDSAGLITWSIGSPIGKMDINDNFSEHIEKLRHTLEIANVLGADNIRIFSFYIPQNEVVEKYRNQVIEYLDQMCEITKGYNINLCHENEKGIYGDIPERCFELFKANPELRCIFDPANFVQCGVDTLRAWDILKDYVYYMHIKDSKKDGLVVPSGFGDGNIKEVAKKYMAKGGMYFTIEPHLAVFDGLKGLEKEGDTSVIGEFEFENNNIAFDTACNTFKKILGEI